MIDGCKFMDQVVKKLNVPFWGKVDVLKLKKYTYIQYGHMKHQRIEKGKMSIRSWAKLIKKAK